MGRKPIKNIERKILSEVMKESFNGGIAAVSTKEVANHLHISEPVIFAHFKTKKNLMVRAFKTAWDEIPHIVCFPRTLSHRDDREAFLKYKDKVNICLAHPIAIVYIADFINSRYYDYDGVLEVEKQYRSDIVALFQEICPSLSLKNLDMLAERFIESSITSISHIVLGHHPHDEDTLFLYWGARIYGFVGSLKMNGAAYPIDAE